MEGPHLVLHVCSQAEHTANEVQGPAKPNLTIAKPQNLSLISRREAAAAKEVNAQ